MFEPFPGSQRDSDSPSFPQLYSPRLTTRWTARPFPEHAYAPSTAFPRRRGRRSLLAAARVVLSVLSFCLDRQVADVFERLPSREPTPDRKGVDREAQQGDGEDVPAERELVAGAVEAEQRNRARCAHIERAEVRDRAHAEQIRPEP